ncbi:MAG: hypothetical protein JKX71_15545 [Amylibacter sp.]|nr:hypothetical protein [Amylibacter sp.]
MKTLLTTLTTVGSLCLPISAQAEAITLNLYAIGIRAGTIRINGAEKGNAYALNGIVTPSALLRLIKDIGFNGTASGRIKNGQYQTRKYAGNVRTGNGSSTVKMHWRRRAPVVDSYKPGREKRDYDISPSKQVGTVDLLTAAYATFVSRPLDKLCNTTHKMFDGRRRTQIRLNAPKISGKTATCSGAYQRVAGFSAHDMQKRVNFPFTMRYVLQDDGMYHFKDFTADATFGKIRAIRK